MKRRLIIVTMIFVFLTAFVSCGKAEAERTRVDCVFEMTSTGLPENFTVDAAASSGKEIFVFGGKPTPDGGYQKEAAVLDMKGLLKSESALDIFPAANGSVIKAVSAKDGGIYLLTCEFSRTGASETETYGLALYKNGASEYLARDINEIMGSLQASSRRGFVPRDIAVDSDGRIYIANESGAAVFDSGMTMLFAVNADTYLRALTLSRDGKVFAAVDAPGGAELVLIDADLKDFSDRFRLGGVLNAEYYSGKNRFDVFYEDGTAVYGASVSDDGTLSSEKLLDYINSDIIPSELGKMYVLDEDLFAVNKYFLNSETGESGAGLALLEKVPDAKIPEKYVIDFAVRQDSPTLMKRVVTFNRRSDEYRVRLTIYDDSSDTDKSLGETLLERELLSGSPPDVILTDGFERAGDWTAAGVFADLNAHIDADGGFDRGDVFDSVLRSLETDGKLYEMPAFFRLRTLMALSETVGRESWSADGFIEFMKTLPDGAYPVGNFGRENILRILLSCTLDSFVDFENGKCYFESETFRNILAFAAGFEENALYEASLSGDALEDYLSDLSEPYRDGKIICLEVNLGAPSELLENEYLFGFGDTVVIGYPTTDGKTSGVTMSPSHGYSITEKSPAEVKAGAWEFVKFMVDEEPDPDFGYRSYSGFPIYRKRFDDFVSCAKSRGYIFHNGGVYSFGGNMSAEDIEKKAAEKNGVYRALTGEDVKTLTDMIESVSSGGYADERIMTILAEESSIYFAGKKTLDETVKVIQNRAETYVSERK